MLEEERLFKILDECLAAGREAALVTVISADGSTPRGPGARMLVFPGGETRGTVGGGKLELLCVKRALSALKTGKSEKAVFSLTPEKTGMLCSGECEVFVEVFSAPVKLLILGAGHVGQRIAEAASVAGIPHSVADDRADFCNRQRFPNAGEIYVEKPDLAVKDGRVDSKTYIIIVTRGHSLDRECLAAALKTGAAYIGMIGSASKVPSVFKSLAAKGLDPARDKRVYSPIGIDCGGKKPGEIAISVLAQVLMVSNKRDGGHLRLR